MLQLIEMMAEGKGIGKVLALGPKEAGEVLGHGASYYSLHVKGMSLTGYEPRTFYGMALTFGFSSRGACHNVDGWTIRDELIKKTVDRYALKGKGILVKVLQDVRAYIDSLGICTVPRRSLGLTDEPNNELLRLVTGLDHESLTSIGERIYSLERLILNREGISRRDDLIPERLRREPLNDGPAKGHVITDEMYDEMLDEYYAARGWDREGKVTRETLKKLEILRWASRCLAIAFSFSSFQLLSTSRRVTFLMVYLGGMYRSRAV